MKSCLPLNRRRIPQRGVVLIEVMVAILIFTFGILGTVALLARATQFSSNAEDRNRAALIANEMVSIMWTRGTTDPAALPVAQWQARIPLVVTATGLTNTAASGLPNGAGDVTRDAAGVATITVRWRPTFATVDSQYTTQVVVP